jgi:hypothetical protein
VDGLKHHFGFADLVRECLSSDCLDCLSFDCLDKQNVDGAGRGIFTRDDVPAGTPLLSVPLKLCFRASREEAVSVPGASWRELTTGVVAGWPRLQVRSASPALARTAHLLPTKAPKLTVLTWMLRTQTFYETYPLPWEVRLAVALLDAAEGNAGCEFWGEWATCWGSQCSDSPCPRVRSRLLCPPRAHPAMAGIDDR